MSRYFTEDNNVIPSHFGHNGLEFPITHCESDFVSIRAFFLRSSVCCRFSEFDVITLHLCHVSKLLLWPLYIRTEFHWISIFS